MLQCNYWLLCHSKCGNQPGAVNNSIDVRRGSFQRECLLAAAVSLATWPGTAPSNRLSATGVKGLAIFPETVRFRPLKMSPSTSFVPAASLRWADDCCPAPQPHCCRLVELSFPLPIASLLFTLISCVGGLVDS